MNVTHRLRECRELVYILSGDLRDLLEEPPTKETVRWIKAVLDALLETIPEELRLKSDNGYLSSVLEDFPNWDGQVSRLEEEYFTLFRRLRSLRHRVERELDYREIAAQTSDDLLDWMTAFKRHIQSEQRIVLLAANLQVGVGD